MFGEMGMKCLRTSIAWSRIFPNGDDAEPNEKGLSYYEDMFRELHRWGIEPVITISHFETPLALVKKYGGWDNRKLVGFFERYCKVLFERYKDQVKYWMTFNEINNTLKLPYLAAGMVVADDANAPQRQYQAAHNMFVANALAVKACHEMIPGAKIGCMLSLSTAYPNTCRPEDVMETYQLRQRSLFFSDVMLRGRYPSYIDRKWEELGVQVQMEPGDFELIAQNTNDYLAFSYYMTSTHIAGMKIRSNTGGHVGADNPYLENPSGAGQSTRWDCDSSATNCMTATRSPCSLLKTALVRQTPLTRMAASAILPAWSTSKAHRSFAAGCG